MGDENGLDKKLGISPKEFEMSGTDEDTGHGRKKYSESGESIHGDMVRDGRACCRMTFNCLAKAGWISKVFSLWDIVSPRCTLNLCKF